MAPDSQKSQRGIHVLLGHLEECRLHSRGLEVLFNTDALLAISHLLHVQLKMWVYMDSIFNTDLHWC